MNPSEIKLLLQEKGFTFSKGLGQNFLINPGICPKMAAESGCEGIGALEIGPGAGVLTAELAGLAKKVVAIELDRRLEPVLEQTLAGYENIALVFGDALKIDLHALLKEQFGDMPVVICANLPYYITSELLMRFLEERLAVEAITVMLQKEAAVRICAPPGSRECGAVSIAVRYYSQPKSLFDVSRGSFFPPPNVDSRVIRLTIHKTPPVRPKDEKVFFGVVKAAFGQRRKTLSNSLSALQDKEVLMQVFQKLGLSPLLRAEQLSLEDFCRISDALTKD